MAEYQAVYTVDGYRYDTGDSLPMSYREEYQFTARGKREAKRIAEEHKPRLEAKYEDPRYVSLERLVDLKRERDLLDLTG